MYRKNPFRGYSYFLEHHIVNHLSPTGDQGNMTPYSRELIRSAVATDSFSTLPQKVSYI